MADNPNPPSEQTEDDGKVRVTGQYIDWSEKDLDALATIDLAVIADALVDAQNFPQLAALLASKTE